MKAAAHPKQHCELGVRLNGRKQWISIRGWDKSAQSCSSGRRPGGTDGGRHELAELGAFVVVNWDQPGSGKSG